MRDATIGAITPQADYSQLGHLFIAVTVTGLALPMLSIVFVKTTRFRSV